MFEWHVDSTGKTPLRVAGMVVAGIVVVSALGLGLGVLVMTLWNWLLPPIFGIKAITYWQAVGMFFLCHLLFGGGHRGHRMGRRGRPEERAGRGK